MGGAAADSRPGPKQQSWGKGTPPASDAQLIANLRVEIERLPISPATRDVARALGADALAWATGGGEDYELLLTCDARALDRLSQGLERVTGTRLHAIGTVTGAGHGVSFVDARGREVPAAAGFEHFVTGSRR